MDQMATLELAIHELHREVAALDDPEMDIVTNCAPWTVRRLASHAFNNQLLWAGLVTGEETVTVEDTMGAVAYDGDLASYADEVAERSLAMWATPGVMTALHAIAPAEISATGRSMSVAITDAGRAAFVSARAAWQSAQDSMPETLGLSARLTLDGWLACLTEGHDSG
jgi:hypothetical protein